MKIINLTQHEITEKQRKMGVIDVQEGHRSTVTEMITYDDIPNEHTIQSRAKVLESIATVTRDIIQMKEGHQKWGVMLGGANFSNPIVEQYFHKKDWTVYYSFSPRTAKETTQDDGTVKTEYIFDFKGFVVKYQNGKMKSMYYEEEEQ